MALFYLFNSGSPSNSEPVPELMMMDDDGTLLMLIRFSPLHPNSADVPLLPDAGFAFQHHYRTSSPSPSLSVFPYFSDLTFSRAATGEIKSSGELLSGPYQSTTSTIDFPILFFPKFFPIKYAIAL